MLLLHKGGLLDICFSAQLPAFKHWIQFVWTERARRGRLLLPRHAPREHPTPAWATLTAHFPGAFTHHLRTFLSGKRENHYDLRSGLNNKHLGERVTLSEVTEQKHTLTGSAVNLWMLVALFGHLSTSLALEQTDLLLCHCSSRLPVERMNTPNLFWTSWRNSRRLFMCRQTDGTRQLFGGKPWLWLLISIMWLETPHDMVIEWNAFAYT